MIPATVLDKLLPRWRAKLPPRFSPEYIDRFIRRNRDALEAVVARAMILRRVKQGEPPRSADEFAMYGKIVARERPRDQEPDDIVIARIVARREKMKVRGRVTPDVAAWLYAEARAMAILLRVAGWDAVPLLLREPALAVLTDGEVVAVMDALAEVYVASGFSQEDRVRADLEQARQRVLALHIDMAEPRLERFANALWSRARAATAAPAAPPSFETPPDLRDRSWRTEANLQAMRIVAAKEPGELTAEDLQAIAQYSGWGGLSIEAVKQLLPPRLVPESFGLVHEYYSPTPIAESIAEAVCPLLPELAGNDGVVRALEPSAGIGRLIRAYSPRRCLALEAGGQIDRIAWTAVEFSKVSQTLLAALRPDVDLYHMPFERFVHTHGARYRGTFGFVVSNPPYGERGAMAREDPDEFYKERRAFAYFMRRALDLLVPGGLGVFLVPAGFLSGNLNRGLREKLLRRHHLLGAFRLPSHDRKGRETVPGASVVMDVVFWRSRGGELTEVDEADQFILDGEYFKANPDHILGKEDGSFAGDDEAGMARSWRYKVTGDFTGLPPLVPRPVCTACVLTSIAPRLDVGTFQTVARVDDGLPADVADELRPALELGRRVGRYLTAVGADDSEKAAQLWPELYAALTDFAATAGNPWRDKALRALAEARKLPAAQQLLGAYEKTGAVAGPLREPPQIQPKFSGQPDDVVAQAEALFRQQRSLTVPQLLDFHAKLGGALTPGDALSAVLTAGWNLDGDAWDELFPADAYLTGNDLWARHDRAAARAATGDEQAKVQVRRLLEAIKPAVFDDLTDLSPQHGYVPLDIVAAWLSSTLNSRYGAVELERANGLVQIRGHRYTDEEPPPIAPETLLFLGYYNHDAELFQPPQERERSTLPLTREERAARKQNLAERRIAQAKKWSDSVRPSSPPTMTAASALLHAYNRVARGRIVPTFTPEPLEIARWGTPGAEAQAASDRRRAARAVPARRRRVLRRRRRQDVHRAGDHRPRAPGGLGPPPGDPRAQLARVEVARRHPVHAARLPRRVIGSKRKQISRGARKGLITSDTDTPQERAQKWTLLQSGQVDVVVLSFDAMARTKMNEKHVLAYVEEVEAVSRSIALRKRALEEKVKSAKQEENLSERERALLKHGVRAWVEEILALPPDWQYDPGVAWDEIGIDMLVVDEAAAFKTSTSRRRARTASRSSWAAAARAPTARGSSTSAPRPSAARPAAPASSC
jgi:hypothetical protein